MKNSYHNTVVLECIRQALVNLLSGDICLTEGVREVMQWRWSNHGLDEELFLPFVGFDSETDKFPLGKIRDLWSAEGLVSADAERMAQEKRSREWVMNSGKILLEAVVTTLSRSTFTDPALG